MSDSEMIEYEIGDDVNDCPERNLAEVQIKNKNDINLQYKKNSKKNLSNSTNKIFKKEKQLLKTNPKLDIETSLNKILQGKTVQNSTTLKNSIIAKNADLKQKNNNANNNFINKKSNFNYSSNASKNYKNFSTCKNFANKTKNEIKESNNKIASLNSFNIHNDKDINTIPEFQGNLKLMNNYNNFNTIGNFETEGFLSTKNKYASTFKMFGNTNSNNKNTINNSAMGECKKSFYNEKTKTITNNKTDYKTINSINIVNNSKHTFIPANEKNSKFEVKLKDHINTLKNQKNIPLTGPSYKENILKKSLNYNQNINIKENKIINSSNNNYNNQANKNNTNSYLNLKLNLDPSNNSNAKENDYNYNDEHPQTTKNDANIKFLLSDKFKNSLDTTLRNSNKSFQCNLSKNKSCTKKSLISFDLSKQIENKRSVSIGERLYRKSIAYKDLKEKRVSIELSKRNLETIGNCSFKPKICEDSIMLSIKVFLN